MQGTGKSPLDLWLESFFFCANFFLLSQFLLSAELDLLPACFVPVSVKTGEVPLHTTPCLGPHDMVDDVKDPIWAPLARPVSSFLGVMEILFAATTTVTRPF